MICTFNKYNRRKLPTTKNAPGNARSINAFDGPLSFVTADVAAEITAREI